MIGMRSLLRQLHCLHTEDTVPVLCAHCTHNSLAIKCIVLPFAKSSHIFLRQHLLKLKNFLTYFYSIFIILLFFCIGNLSTTCQFHFFTLCSFLFFFNILSSFYCVSSSCPQSTLNLRFYLSYPGLF